MVAVRESVYIMNGYDGSEQEQKEEFKNPYLDDIWRLNIKSKNLKKLDPRFEEFIEFRRSNHSADYYEPHHR